MILTCPSCGTQYEVKDGAIPPQGRQVRCASCKHSWHQDPERADDGGEGEPLKDEADSGGSGGETIAEAAMIEPRSGPEAEERAFTGAALAADDQSVDNEFGAASDTTEHVTGEHLAGDDNATPPGYAPINPVAPPADALVEANPAASVVPAGQYDERAAGEEPWAAPADEAEDDFSPFAEHEDEPPRRSPLLRMLLAALMIAALAAAFWFLAPPEWKQRIGIAGVGETPLQLMMTHSDRQKLASGNELLAVSGRVINPTDENQAVPPIKAQLRSSSGQLVYSWTIAPPARTLPPGASATFNSAEVNVPAGGDELTITLGGSET